MLIIQRKREKLTKLGVKLGEIGGADLTTINYLTLKEDDYNGSKKQDKKTK